MKFPVSIPFLVGWLFCLAGFPVTTAGAAAPECTVCGTAIRGRYLTANGKDYCSERCLARTRPLCSVCKRRCGPEYLTSGDRAFCSRHCLEKKSLQPTLSEKQDRSKTPSSMVKREWGDS